MTYPSTLQPPVYQAPPADQPPPDPRRSLFAVSFAIAAAAITALSIVLAVIAPSLNSSSAPTVPSEWSKPYDANPRPGESQWPTTSGCALENQGLHVTGQDSVGIACAFQPSRQQDLLSNGFMLNVSLAPGANVQSLEEAVIILGGSGEVRIDQTGLATICTPTCGIQDASVTQVSAFAWHGEAANTFTVRWLGPGNPLTVYTNGQQALTADFHFIDGNHILLLGTPKQDEAIYTHMTLYSAS